MIKKVAPSTIIWDLDGTLIDQFAPIFKCYELVITKYGYEKPKIDYLRKIIGGTLKNTLSYFLKEEEINDAEKLFREIFPGIMYDGLKLHDHAISIIQKVKKNNITQIILTNKDGATARAICKKLNISNYISSCFGAGDTIYNKPDPRFTRHALNGIDACKSMILIGDSPTDVNTAKNYGIDCYAICTGTHTKEELTDAGARITFNNLKELDEHLGLQV